MATPDATDGPTPAKPSPAAPLIANKAALKFSQLRSSFSLSRPGQGSSAPTTSRSKYAAAALAAQSEDLTRIPQHNAGIDSKPAAADAKKAATEELRRKIMGRPGRREDGGNVRTIGNESSDEEEGRSGLGRAKRRRVVQSAKPRDEEDAKPVNPAPSSPGLDKPVPVPLTTSINPPPQPPSGKKKNKNKKRKTPSS